MRSHLSWRLAVSPVRLTLLDKLLAFDVYEEVLRAMRAMRSTLHRRMLPPRLLPNAMRGTL